MKIHNFFYFFPQIADNLFWVFFCFFACFLVSGATFSKILQRSKGNTRFLPPLRALHLVSWATSYQSNQTVYFLLFIHILGLPLVIFELIQFYSVLFLIIGYIQLLKSAIQSIRFLSYKHNQLAINLKTSS